MENTQVCCEFIFKLILNPYFLLLALFGYPLLKFTIFLIIEIVKKLLPMPDFKKKYCQNSKDSWAVVTGATDGIGLGFCKILAKLGFNIVLISRNAEKLKQTVETLKNIKSQKSQKPQFKTITFDFYESSDSQKQLDGLDIWLLINNVGTNYIGQQKDMPYQKVIDLINLNCTSITILSARLFANMNKRQQKSAVINISSLAGDRGIPYFAVYSATKSFTNQLTEGLRHEYQNIDMLCLRPVLVESNISRVKKGLFVPSSQQYAQSAIKQLAYQIESYGTFTHQIIGYIYSNFIPHFIFNRYAGSALKGLLPNFKND